MQEDDFKTLLREVEIFYQEPCRATVDDTGIEPVTPTMSMWCSTAEPIVLGG